MVWGARESGPAMVLLGPQLTVSSIGGERALQPPLKEKARACCVLVRDASSWPWRPLIVKLAEIKRLRGKLRTVVASATTSSLACTSARL